MMAALFGLAMANLFLRSSMGVLAPELAADLGLAPSAQGATASAFFFAYALFQIPGGMLLDRFGPRRVIVSLFCLTAAGTFLFAFAPDGGAMLTARVVMGIGCAAVFPGAFMLIGRFYPSDRLTSVAGAMNSFAMMGMFLATLPLAYLVTHLGWRESFTYLAVATTALTVFAALTIQDRPDAGTAPPPRAKKSLAQILGGLHQALKTRHVLNIASAGVALSGGSVILGVWGGPYLNDVHGLD